MCRLVRQITVAINAIVAFWVLLEIPTSRRMLFLPEAVVYAGRKGRRSAKPNLLKIRQLISFARFDLWVIGDSVAGQTQSPSRSRAQKSGPQMRSEARIGSAEVGSMWRLSQSC